MKWIIPICSVMLFSLAHVSIAQAASIKVSPLKYEQQLSQGKILVGAVDVSNPSDTQQKFSARVQAFRQTNEAGELEFYSDQAIETGVLVDQPEFTLGAHQVARIFFSINPDKLPQTGIYAAVLFDTNPNQPNTATQLSTSVSSGTLLILDNTRGGTKTGEIINVRAKFWQFGSGISAFTTYKNTGSGTSAVAFNPQLALKAVPWGRAQEHTGSLVFPGNQRQIKVTKQGNYFGMLPLQVSDVETGTIKTKWVFALTGYWVVIAPIFFILGGVITVVYYRHSMRERASEY